jgi:hypothetical protein
MEKSFPEITLDVSVDLPDHLPPDHFALNGRAEKSFHETYYKRPSLEDLRAIVIPGYTPL